MWEKSYVHIFSALHEIGIRLGLSKQEFFEPLPTLKCSAPRWISATDVNTCLLFRKSFPELSSNDLES